MISSNLVLDASEMIFACQCGVKFAHEQRKLMAMLDFALGIENERLGGEIEAYVLLGYLAEAFQMFHLRHMAQCQMERILVEGEPIASRSQEALYPLLRLAQEHASERRECRVDHATQRTLAEIVLVRPAHHRIVDPGSETVRDRTVEDQVDIDDEQRRAQRVVH